MNLFHLVLVTSSFPIQADGSEAAGSFVADFVVELAQHCKVTVVAPGTENAREQWSNGIEIFRYEAPPQALSTLKLWRPADFRWIVKVLLAGQTATRKAVSGGASHVLALWGLPCGEWARRATYKVGIDYSVWMLGSDVWTLGRIPILRWILARVMRQAKNAWADGHKLAEDATRIGGIPVGFLPSARAMALRNPPPPRQQAPYRFLFLGRWHYNKGIDLMLDALIMLSDEDWQYIELVEIHGGGPMHDLVHENLTKLRTENRPVMVGKYLAKPDAEEAIVRADWVLIPSRIESIPVIFSDAMKLGRAVIATPVGDLPRLLESGCGILCSAVNAKAIAESMHRAIISGGCDLKAIATQAAAFSLESTIHQVRAGIGAVHVD